MRNSVMLVIAAAAASASASPSAFAQQTSFVYRLGRDTVAIEQFTRSGNRITGETVNRSGAAVTRLQYEVTLGNDGRPTSLVYRPRTAADTAATGAATEIRYSFRGDSVTRDAVFRDSTSRRVMPATRATPFQAPAFGLWEIAFGQMRRANQANATFAVIGTGANPGSAVFTSAGDTIRAADGRFFVVDREGRI